jgi:hypothetical protein
MQEEDREEAVDRNERIELALAARTGRRPPSCGSRSSSSRADEAGLPACWAG